VIQENEPAAEDQEIPALPTDGKLRGPFEITHGRFAGVMVVPLSFFQLRARPEVPQVLANRLQNHLLQ
jgi:hypothetical protein